MAFIGPLQPWVERRWACVRCGHDTEGEGGNDWQGPGGGRICKGCCSELAAGLSLLLTLDSISWDEIGVTVYWHDVARMILAVKMPA